MDTMGTEVIMDLTTIIHTITGIKAMPTTITEETIEVDIQLETVIEEMPLVLETQMQTLPEEILLMLEGIQQLEILEM